MTFNVGDVATLTYTLTVDDAPTDATVVLTVTSPTGVVSTPSVAHPGVGSYSADIVVGTAGTWSYRWVASGAATDVETGTFSVGAGVSLREVKAHLDIDSSDDTHDDELTRFLSSAIEVVEGIVGPISARTVTETHYGRRGGTLFLHQSPVVSVQTMTKPGGYAYDVDNLTVDTTAGAVLDRTSYSLYGDITVTYTVGRNTVPASIREAVLELVRLHWAGSQGGYRPGYGTQDDEGARNPIGFYIPGKVLELLEPHRLPPAIG